MSVGLPTPPFEIIDRNRSTQQQLIEKVIERPECLTHLLTDARTIQTHFVENPDNNFGISIPDEISFEALATNRHYLGRKKELTYTSDDDNTILRQHLLQIHPTKEPTSEEIAIFAHKDFAIRQILVTYRELILFVDSGITNPKALRALIINPTAELGASRSVIDQQFSKSSIQLDDKNRRLLANIRSYRNFLGTLLHPQETVKDCDNPVPQNFRHIQEKGAEKAIPLVTALERYRFFEEHGDTMMQFLADSLGCPVTDHNGKVFKPASTPDAESVSDQALVPDKALPNTIEQLLKLEDPTKIQTAATSLTEILDSLEETIHEVEAGISTDNEALTQYITRKEYLHRLEQNSTTEITTLQTELAEKRVALKKSDTTSDVSRQLQYTDRLLQQINQQLADNSLTSSLARQILDSAAKLQTFVEGKIFEEQTITRREEELQEKTKLLTSTKESRETNNKNIRQLTSQVGQAQQRLQTLNELQTAKADLHNDIDLVEQQATPIAESEEAIELRNNPVAQQAAQLFSNAAGKEQVDTEPVSTELIEMLKSPAFLEMIQTHWQLSQEDLEKLTSNLNAVLTVMQWTPTNTQRTTIKTMLLTTITDPQARQRIASTLDISQPPKPLLDANGQEAYKRIREALEAFTPATEDDE